MLAVDQGLFDDASEVTDTLVRLSEGQAGYDLPCCVFGVSSGGLSF